MAKSCLPYFRPIKEGIEILKAVRAKGYRTYVLSNFHKDYYESISETYRDTEIVFSAFDGATVSSFVRQLKPYREIYECLLRDNGIKAEETLFIDDSPENVRGAQEVGIDAVLCDTHDNLRRELERRGVL
jgi:putative hydrolase of the HAD superfamily